jgi:hypothetical protein
MNVTELAGGLCGDLVRSVAQRGTRSFIVTNFRYPDGDSVNLYLESKGASEWLTDLGTTIFKYGTNGLELSDSRRQFIQAICNTYGLELEKTVFRKRLTVDRPGLDCLSFCEALSRISTLEYQKESRHKGSFFEQVDNLLKHRVEAVRKIERRWTDPLIDPNQSFPVDYRMNGTGTPRNLFYVATADKSNLVSAVCNFFKIKGVYVPTMSVIDPDLNLGKHHMDRLQLASTHLRFGVVGSEDAIVEFASERTEWCDDIS